MIARRFLCVAVSLAVVSACGETPTTPLLPSLAVVPGSADQTVKMVPFRAINTNEQTVPDFVCPAGELAISLAITGKGTHLGKFTGAATGCVGFVSGTYSRIITTFVAANGDELRTEMDPSFPGQIVEISGPGNPIVTVGGLNVVGGTGRFEGATGSLTFRSEGILGVPGSAVTTTSGEIASPGSIRRSTS